MTKSEGSWDRFIQAAADGQVNLHVWRDGQEYFRQKSELFLREFTNVKFGLPPHPTNRPFIYHDLSKPLSFAGETFNNIDAYHVLEHLSWSEGRAFVKELCRVLKPGGVLRLSTPDLERGAREYLINLDAVADHQTTDNLQNYAWAVYELLDQATREYSGGKMADALKEGRFNPSFIHDRYGDALVPLVRKYSSRERSNTLTDPTRSLFRIDALSVLGLSRRIAHRCLALRHRIARRIGGRQGRATPYETREAVRWQHDRMSLRQLIEDAGFIEFRVVDFKTSRIPNWDRYQLDKSNYGDYPFDPSVYIECAKSV